MIELRLSKIERVLGIQDDDENLKENYNSRPKYINHCSNNSISSGKSTTTL
jgi:hypothetical protein